MELAQNIQAVRAKIAQAAADAGRTPGEITLCAATKVQTDETIRAAIAAGVQVCGENRVQELTAHLEAGAYEGAGVHFIGHLQTNKVKQVVGKVELIHSVDSERLLRAIHSQAEKLGIVQDILLEVNIAGEESKGGCSPQEAEELAQTVALYFAEDGDVRRCAEKLFVHRNTFQYRMDTVKRKTGLDLRCPRDAALLYLVLRQ